MKHAESVDHVKNEDLPSATLPSKRGFLFSSLVLLGSILIVLIAASMLLHAPFWGVVVHFLKEGFR